MELNSLEDNIPIIPISDIVMDMEEPIGRGGFGAVYRGTHQEYGFVAVKMLVTDGVLTRSDSKLLESEGKKLRAFCLHPSIVTLLGLTMERNNYSLVLEYMCLGSVRDLVKTFKPGFPLLIRIVRDVIHGMDFLHSQNPAVLHLDLKADNILINKDINAKICDFGLAQIKSMTQSLTRRSGEGRCCTVTHVPPEVWANINTKSDKSYDVYSFGIVIWEILSGHIPYGHASKDLISTVVKAGQRPDVTVLHTNTPPLLIDMMNRCWIQQPTQRPSFTKLKNEIEPLYQSREREIPSIIKDIRRRICEEYSANDPEYSETNHLDYIEVPTISEPVDSDSHSLQNCNDDLEEDTYSDDNPERNTTSSNFAMHDWEPQDAVPISGSSAATATTLPPASINQRATQQLSSLASNSSSASVNKSLETDAIGGRGPQSKSSPLPAASVPSIRSLTHHHNSGEVTRIKFGAGAETPNLQVGSHNVMVVNNGRFANDDESKPKPKPSNKLILTDSTSTVTSDDLDLVSAEIGKDWRKLGRALNITDGVLDQLNMDFNISGTYEVMYQTLNKWIQREARNATKRLLAEKLHEIDRDDIAKDIK